MDGHDIEEIVEVLGGVGLDDKPLAIIAKTYKGAGVSFLQDKDGWHGKPLEQGRGRQGHRRTCSPAPNPASACRFQRRTSCPRPNNAAPGGLSAASITNSATKSPPAKPTATRSPASAKWTSASSPWTATRKIPPTRTSFSKNSPTVPPNVTSPNRTWSASPRALARAAKCRLPRRSPRFSPAPSDQIRVAGISQANLKLVGSHVGVSIGEDGPSQMALEDLAMMRAIVGSMVLYPSDAVATEKLVEQMALTKGICFLRTSRPKTPVIYGNDEQFPIGGAKVLRRTGDKVTVVAAGVTLYEALKAADALKAEGIGITVIDAYSIKPLGKEEILAAAQKDQQHRHHRGRPLSRRRLGRRGRRRIERGRHQGPQAGRERHCRVPARRRNCSRNSALTPRRL